MSWLAAFKVIPWADVLAAAPAVAQGARKLWSSVKAGSAAVETQETEPLETRVHAVEACIAELKQENAASSELVKSLAEQNARLVEIVGMLKTRTQVLLIVSIVTSVAALILALWSVFR